MKKNFTDYVFVLKPYASFVAILFLSVLLIPFQNCSPSFKTDSVTGVTNSASSVLTEPTPLPVQPTTPDSQVSAGSGSVQASFMGTNEDFLNPERGFYVTPNSGEMNQSTLSGFVDSWHTRLFLYIISLDGYQSTSILPASFLSDLNTKFNEGRKAGVKFIVLVEYTASSSGQDAQIGFVQSHAAQLKSVFTANADVIPYVKAGFIGAWGEWHDSPNGLDTKNNMRLVKDAVLNMTAVTTQVQFSPIYPMQEDWFATALNASMAFNGSSQARMGFHSDCFLTGNGDSYRYFSPQTVVDFTTTKTATEQRKYTHDVSEFVPYGGETCDNSQGASQQMRTACSGSTDELGQSGGIMNEGPRYHLTWLNAGYAPNFISQWKSEGCFDTVAKMMGYRFQLDSVQHAAVIAKGQAVAVNVDLKNLGWSRIFSARKLVVTLKHKTNNSAALISAGAGDLRLLASQATSSTRMTVNVAIPSTAVMGDYDVYLSAPDIFMTTASDPRYSVRFANSDNTASGQVWDVGHAWFKLGTTLTVQ